MIRPLYRWKSFWFGVLVIAFLGWAWARSMTFADSLSWTGDGVSVGVINLSAKAEFYCEKSSALKPSWFTYHRFKVVDRSPKWFRPSLQRSSYFLKRSKVQVSQVWIAHWLLMLIFALVWSAWLFLNWRREQKTAWPFKQQQTLPLR